VTEAAFVESLMLVERLLIDWFLHLLGLVVVDGRLPLRSFEEVHR